MPFTDRQVASLKPKPTRYEKPEPGRTGLSIRVTPNGVKTWAFRYRFAGEQKRMVLGTYPSLPVSKAHAALADAKLKLEDGIDPGAVVAEGRKAEREAETVAELAAEYLERHAKRKKKASSAAGDERLINKEIVPHWGKRKAKEITRRDVIKLLDGVESRAPVTRNRLAALLSRMFRFGMDRGIVDASPAVGIERLEEKPRDRVLTLEEIHSFWTGLDAADMTQAVRVGLRLLLVTGQRRAEVAGTPRAEVDDAAALWRLSGDRTKNGKPNVIPLPTLAMRLIGEADETRVRKLPTRPNRKDRPAYDPTPSPWLFPAHRIGKPIEPAALTRALNRNRDKLGIGDARVHDLRRAFATYHGELGTPPEILSALLNHSAETITARVYNRAENIEARRAAMKRWCSFLELVTAGKLAGARKMFGADVVPMKTHAQAVSVGE